MQTRKFEVEETVAVGFIMFEALRPVEGLQLKVKGKGAELYLAGVNLTPSFVAVHDDELFLPGNAVAFVPPNPSTPIVCPAHVPPGFPGILCV